MIRRLAMALVLSCIVLHAQADAEFALGVGTHAGVGREGADAIVRYLGAGRFGAIRDDLLWSRVQARGGDFAPDAAVKELDALIAEANRSGTQVVLILGYGNRAAGVRGLADTPDERRAFARYVEWAVTRYRDRVQFFEIWNEWNIGLGSGPKPWRPGSAADYVALLGEMYPLIRRLAPNARVLGGGIAGTDTKWLREFVRLGGPGHLDGLSVHPYVHFKGKAGLPERAIEWLDMARATLVAKGWSGKHLYVTEIGWPDSTTPEGVESEQVADFLVRFLVLARSRSDWLKGVWWYELVDGGNRSGNNEHNFGMYRRGGEPKPAAAAMDHVRRLLERFDGWREHAVGADARLVVAESSGGGGACVVVWSVFGRSEAIALAGDESRPTRIRGGGQSREDASTGVRVTAETQPQTWCVEQGRIAVVPRI